MGEFVVEPSMEKCATRGSDVAKVEFHSAKTMKKEFLILDYVF